MIITGKYEIVSVADEYFAIPIGEATKEMNGFISLNEAMAYLINNSDAHFTKENWVELLINEYDVSFSTANADVCRALELLIDFGLVEEESGVLDE